MKLNQNILKEIMEFLESNLVMEKKKTGEIVSFSMKKIHFKEILSITTEENEAEYYYALCFLAKYGYIVAENDNIVKVSTVSDITERGHLFLQNINADK